MANNRTHKEHLSQEQMAASHVVQIHTHACFLRSKKWPTYHVAVPTGNALALQQSIFRNDCLNFQPSSAAEKVSIICGTNKHVKSAKYRNPRCACAQRVNEGRNTNVITPQDAKQKDLCNLL